MMPVPLSRKQRKPSRRRVSFMPLEGTPTKSEVIFSWVSMIRRLILLFLFPQFAFAGKYTAILAILIVGSFIVPMAQVSIVTCCVLPCSFLQETQLLFRAFLMNFILCCACGMAFKFITLNNNHSTFGMSRMTTPRTSFSPMMSQSQKTHQRRRVGSKDDDSLGVGTLDEYNTQYYVGTKKG